MLVIYFCITLLVDLYEYKVLYNFQIIDNYFV